MRISIVGAGYVGLVTGACFAKLGNNVIILDIDKEKLEKIKRGIPPIYEEGLDELLKNYRYRIEVTQDYNYAVKESEITFICVGTPSKEDGSIDLSYVKEVARSIGIALRGKKEWHLVVVKSTVLPGTTTYVVLSIGENFSGNKVGKDFGKALNPEILRKGKAVKDLP